MLPERFTPKAWCRRVVAAAIMACAMFAPAHADPVTGTDLAAMCQRHEQRASYYILGAVDAFSAPTGSAHKFCIPRGSEIPGVHMTNVVCRYVVEHPAQPDKDASVLVYRALRDAFPCGRRR